MPLVSTVGTGSAQGFGENVTPPAVFTGVPIENFFQTGTVVTGLGTAWSITCAGMPGSSTTSQGWSLMLIRIGQINSGTRSYLTGATYVFDSLIGVGNYIGVAVGATADATSLTSVTGYPTDTVFNFGTSAAISGNATRRIIYKYYAFYQGSTSFGFTKAYYSGTSVANRVVTGATPAVTWQPLMAMVLNSAGQMVWWNSSMARNQAFLTSGYEFSPQASSSAPTTYTSLWGNGTGAGANAITVGFTTTVATITNQTGRNHICWMFDTSATYGSKAAQRAFSRSTYTGNGSLKAVAVTPTLSLTHDFALMVNFASGAVSNPVNWSMNEFGTSAGTNVAGYLAPNPFSNVGGRAAEAQGANGSALFSYAAGTSGWNTGAQSYFYMALLLPYSDWYVNASKYRPFSAGFKSQQKITAGATSANISINPNRYPCQMATIWVITANGIGGVNNRIYSRHFGFYQETVSGTQFALTLNGAANTSSDIGGYDGENLVIAPIASGCNYALLVNYFYPGMFDISSTRGTATFTNITWNLQAKPSFFMAKNMSSTANTWLVWHSQDPLAYYSFNSSVFSRTATNPWFGSPTVSGGTITSFGTLLPFANQEPTAFMAWAENAGVQITGKYAGNSGTQTIFTNFTVGAVIILEASEGMFMFTQAIGMTSGSNYAMRLSSPSVGASLGDVCLQVAGGFQMASSTTLNTAGRTYYYIAFAQ